MLGTGIDYDATDTSEISSVHVPSAAWTLPITHWIVQWIVARQSLRQSAIEGFMPPNQSSEYRHFHELSSAAAAIVNDAIFGAKSVEAAGRTYGTREIGIVDDGFETELGPTR